MDTSTDLVRNAADKEQVRAAERTLKQRRKQDLLDLQAVLEIPAGRRLLWRWMERLDPPERLYEIEPAVMGYKVANRDVAVMIRNEIEEANPEALLRMHREDIDRKKAESAALTPKKRKDEDGDQG